MTEVWEDSKAKEERRTWAVTFARMQAHAQREAPRECCGLVVRDANGEQWTIPIANIARDPERNFEMSPGELMVTFQDYPVIVGSYHSHPAGPPQPSSTDLKFAHPNLRHWLVCGGKVLEWSQDGLVNNA